MRATGRTVEKKALSCASAHVLSLSHTANKGPSPLELRAHTQLRANKGPSPLELRAHTQLRANKGPSPLELRANKGPSPLYVILPFS